MSTDPRLERLAEAGQAYRDLAAQTRNAREQRDDLIRELSADRDVKQVEIVKATRLTRERIRTIAAAPPQK